MNQLELNFPDTRYTFADFFCGCGGLSLGFIKAGLKCISAMDISPEAISTYWYNLCYKGWSHLWIRNDNESGIKKIKKILGDGHTSNFLFKNGIPDNWLSIQDPMPCMNLFLYSILEIEPEEWMDIIGVRPGDIKIFAGGPPCQGFSIANTNRNMYDKRNQLPLRFIYYAKICQPDYVLIENVPGLVTLGKKKGEKEGPFVKWIKEAFNEAGYDIEYQIHNAADYGVPQNRKRVLFFAVRKGINNIQFSEPSYGDGPGKIPYQTVLEAIGELPPINSGEAWGKNVYHPYGYNHRTGYVICRKCLKYNKEERSKCIHCGEDLKNPIMGGVLKIPGLGLLIDTENSIDNEDLRKYNIYKPDE